MQKLAEICVRRPVFATMLVLALTAMGVFAYGSLGVDRFPNVDLPYVVVSTAYPGASPEEVERDITNRIEAEVNSVSGIELLSSSSVEGLSTVTLQFRLGKNPDVAAQEVRQQVDLIANDLPRTARQPVVQKMNANAAAVLMIAASGPYALDELTEVVRTKVAERLQSVSGAGAVRIIGGRNREVQIEVDPLRLRAYSLTVADVVSAARAQNLELPGGGIAEGATRLSLRAQGKLRAVSDFGDIVITTRNGYPIRVRDVGQVRENGAEPTATALHNGQTAVVLAVQKQTGANTVAVIEALRERLDEIRPTLPPDLQMDVVRDQSGPIEASLHAIQEHLVIGGLLASLVVWAFLRSLRATVIAAIAIPTSVISSFALMAALGYTLNEITMLALTLMVGIVIDDAIVVLENIEHVMHSRGLDPFTAAIEGTREIGLAVMATTLSLLAVFVPIGFMGGIVGRFLASFGLTSAAAIAVSLLVSFTLTPMLAARWKETKRHEDTHSSGWYGVLDRLYLRLLSWCMDNRWKVAVFCVLIVLSTVPLSEAAGGAFLPDEDEGEFSVFVRMPPGTSLAATETRMETIAEHLRRQLPGVVGTLTMAGYNSDEQPNFGQIFVRLTPAKERSQGQAELLAEARRIVFFYQDVVASVQGIDPFGANERGADVTVVLTGPDLAKLDDYSRRAIERLRKDPLLADVDRSLESAKPELQLAIRRDRAADLGVSVEGIAATVNALYAGEEVGTFSRGKEQYKVKVKAALEARQDRSSLAALTVPNSQGAPVELRSLVEPRMGRGPDGIDHLNRERSVSLYANVPAGSSELQALQAVTKHVEALGLEPGYRLMAEGNSKELERTNYYFLLAFGLSFVFMYLVLAAQFESFIHPVTILLTLPIAVPFGLLATVLSGQPMNLYSSLGVLLLFGVVKKNGILQIDRMNQLRAQGMPRAEAILQANRERLRPILMTTIALVIGMLPLLTGKGPGAEANRSIGVLVIGGQSLCLIVTLVAVPVFYELFEDAQHHPAWSRLGSWLTRWQSRLSWRRRPPVVNS